MQPEQQVRNVSWPYRIYLYLITTVGVFLIVWGGFTLGAATWSLGIFLLLLLLATAASIATTSSTVSEEAGVTYHVHNAISFAAVPFFGPAAATVIEAAANLSTWLVKPKDETTWKKSGQQLAFNTAMMAIAIFLAGHTFLLTQQQLEQAPALAATIPWLAGALVYGQVNVWLLIGILYLQHGQQIRPLAVWKENAWYQLLDVILMGVGGAILAYAVARYSWPGIVIFFLPIILSSLAFRLYVREMQDHMSNLEEIVAERTRELREVSEEKDAFLAVLTHDMKTPLTSIGLYASMIHRRPQLMQEKPEMAAVIVRNQQVLLEIVNNILDLEKLESHGSLPIEKEEFELVALAETAVEALRPQAEDRNTTLESHLPSPPLLAYADPGQVKRVLMNLISNAIKYTDKGGKVRVTIEQEDDTAICRVTDNGYGIPATELPYIFDRYRRVGKHKDKAVGTGLGLSVTQALVAAHGGEIQVESEEGTGSTFTIILPILSQRT